MHVEDKTIGWFTPSPNNPKKNNQKAINALADCIRDVGFLQPIVTNEEGEILAGHTRYYAGKLLEMSELPTLIAHGLTEEQQRAYRIRDNTLNEIDEWDNQNLANELADLFAAGVDIEEKTGFSEGKLNSLQAELSGQVVAKPEPVTKVGDIWHLTDTHSIVCSGKKTDLSQFMATEESQTLLINSPKECDKLVRAYLKTSTAIIHLQRDDEQIEYSGDISPVSVD